MLDFSKIRGGSNEGKRASFEHLVCLLAQRERRDGQFRRIEGAGGDGGVEALWILPTGKKIGYQAKYYPEKIDWSSIDDSVVTALTHHGELEAYTIALPRDFTGKRAARGGSTEGEWGKWDHKVREWRALAERNAMRVEFTLWTAFEIEAALMMPGSEPLMRFFFEDTLTFTRDWMQHHLLRTITDLQARYSPSEHVDTESLWAFDVLYRRREVVEHLQRVFDCARASCPREAAKLVAAGRVAEEDILTVEKTIGDFVALEPALHERIPTPWPIWRWFVAWKRVAEQLSELTDRIARYGDDASIRDDAAKLTKAYEFGGPEAFGGRLAWLLPVDLGRALVVVGRAGSGKSHALARGAEKAFQAGAPVIHLLGQHFREDDPRTSIRNRLELGKWEFRDILAALNLAAVIAGTRALLIVDGLNEGRGLDIWRHHLSSIVAEANAHPRIVLILSCREEYLPYVITPELIATPSVYPLNNGENESDWTPLGKLMRVATNGFRTTEERERALQIFMDEKEIARPTAPVLDDEFYNPLFMSSVCRAMAKAGIKVFPLGLHGTSTLFSFVLQTKAKALGTRYDGLPAVVRTLDKVLNELAREMVNRRTDWVPLDRANVIIAGAFATLPISDASWLSVLEGSDILRVDVESREETEGPSTIKPNEVVRFSFQRWQEHLMARWLLQSCVDIDRAFNDGREFAFLLKRTTRNGVPWISPTRAWIGLLGALWALVSERNKKELWDLPSFAGGIDSYLYREDFQPVFRIAIRERDGNAFTDRTWELFSFFWQERYNDKLEILLSTSCVPGHAWNADFIASRFCSLGIEDRAHGWSERFAKPDSSLVQRADGIAEWAINAGVGFDEEVLRLAGLILVLISFARNADLREKAAAGLENILTHTAVAAKLRSKYDAESEIGRVLAARSGKAK